MGGFARLTPALFAAAIGVALLSSAIPYTMEMIALKELPASTGSALTSGRPKQGDEGESGEGWQGG